jgi:hypothetical protein
MRLVGDRQARLWINGLEAHYTHEAGHSLMVDCKAVLVVQASRHFAIPVKRRSCVFLVNEPHQFQVERRFSGRLPIVGRPVEAD